MATNRGPSRGTVTREAILNEAKRIFRTKGYRATSLETVATEFNISRPALYYHFRRKDDILFAIYQQVSQALWTGANAILDQPISSAEKFRKIIHHHTLTILENSSGMAVYYDESNELPEPERTEVRDSRRRYTQMLIALFAGGVADGTFPDLVPKLTVYVILGACNWSYKWFETDGPVSAEEMAAFTDQLLFTHLMLPQPARSHE